MSDYRRLISYIYAYEGGIKGKNIGFAKLEARNGQCKIQVNVRKIYVGNQDTGVYLLTESSEIFIGKIFLRNGVGEFRTVVSVADVAETGKTLDQCYGLTIHNLEDSWQSYTTIWEDAVAHAAAVDLNEVTSEQIEQRIKQPQMSNGSQTPTTPELQPQIPSEPEIMPQAPEPEIPVQIPPEAQPAAQPEPELPPVQPPEIETPQRTAQSSKLHTIDSELEQQQSKQLEQLEKEENDEGVETGKLWQYFRRTYPKIQAFDYNGDCEILTIKPQDIGLLPREIWGYGNNSFPLHGYYNHRYLILARLHSPKGECRFLLGVPGHYYSNEKYMASMFGFPNFVLSKMQPSEDGRFGYWYTDIKML